MYYMSKLQKLPYPSHSCFRKYYNKNLDKTVGLAFYQNEPQGYRELKRTIEGDKYLSRGLSSDVYYRHIKRLREANLITTTTNTDRNRGEKLHMRLTDKGRPRKTRDF